MTFALGGVVPDLSQKRVVDAIRPEAVRRLVWDSRPGRTGFGLDVWPSGKRSWVYQYRADGRSRRMTLGNAATMAPKAAEALYLEQAAAVAAGRDPLTERRGRRTEAQRAQRARAAAPTVDDLAARYLASLAKARSPRWHAEATRLVAKHIRPALGARRVGEVTTADVRALHEALADRPVTANRVRAVLSAILTRAILDGVHPGPNPATVLADFPERARARYLTDPEWPRLAAALAAVRAELEHAPAWDTRAAQLDGIVLLLLTGARRDALRLRRWEDVTEGGRVLRVQPAHKGADRIVLGRAAAAYVRWMRQARRRAGAPVAGPLFPGQPRDGRPAAPLSSFGVVWDRVRALAGLEDLTLHDLRRSFATVAGDVGVSDHLIGGLLAHAVPGVRRRYAHRTDAALLAAADRVAAAVRGRLRLGREG